MVITFFSLGPKVSYFYMHFCDSMAKNPPTQHRYPAKLMLFGEYTALLGGHVLATPLTTLWAEWDYGHRFPHPNLAQNCHNVTKIYPFLTFDHQKWDNWLQNLGFLRSSVPVGYGLGSSGNLIAAIYDGFFTTESGIQPDLLTLKSILGFLESYFHGSSSGVDPLISYTQKTLLFTPEEVTETPLSADLLSLFQTVDSGQRRNTEVLVKDFKSRLSDSNFKSQMEILAHHNLQAIEAMISGNPAEVQNHFYQISKLQYTYLNHLITESLQSDWKKGLDTGHNLFKICGAGGGGYFLQFNY